MEAVVNVVWAQPEKCGKDFSMTASYLGQMVTKKGYTMQSILIAKTRSQPAKPKVVILMGNIEFKKYPKEV